MKADSLLRRCCRRHARLCLAQVSFGPSAPSRLHLRFSAAIPVARLLIALAQAMIWLLESDWVVSSIACIFFEMKKLWGEGEEARGAQSKMVAPAPLCFLCFSLLRWPLSITRGPSDIERRRQASLWSWKYLRRRGLLTFPLISGSSVRGGNRKRSRLLGVPGRFSARFAHRYLEHFLNVYEWSVIVCFSETSHT